MQKIKIQITTTFYICIQHAALVLDTAYNRANKLQAFNIYEEVYGQVAIKVVIIIDYLHNCDYHLLPPPLVGCTEKIATILSFNCV